MLDHLTFSPSLYVGVLSPTTNHLPMTPAVVTPITFVRTCCVQ